MRGTTEWVETLEGEGPTSVLVGLDATAAREALDRLAPAERAPADAVERARVRTIETDGATESIARLLA
jgi:hypothetical protein